MSGELGYDPAAMKTGASAVQQAHSEIRSLLTQLQGDVDSLMGGWQSSAASQFSALHANWSSKASEINKALDVMHTKLGETDRTYVSNESQQTEAFSQLNRF